MKIAQLLGTIPDLVPKEYRTELAHLQADAPSMGWAFVKRRMTAELGHGWEKRFKSFEQSASYAASLGQVHKAKSHDGRALACKLQYPDMASVVEADLQQLKIVLGLFERFNRSVSTKDAYEEIAARMREELDYEREAKHIRLFSNILSEEKTPPRGHIPSPLRGGLGRGAGRLARPEVTTPKYGVHVPEVIDALSTDRLLTMTWMDGERMVNAADTRSQKDRNAIAVNMFRAWYVPFYEYGIIHGDPHLGNYTVRKDNSINLLDFGCIRVFSPKLIQAIIWLYEALLKNDDELAIEAYRAWGFSQINKKLVDVLNVWARFVYAPLLNDKKSLIEETNTGLYGRETALKVYGELREIGGVAIPREFVFIDRATLGLGAVFLRLRAEINWHQLFHETIKNFDAKTLAKQQNGVLKKEQLET